jgi:hypothetical protein
MKWQVMVTLTLPVIVDDDDVRPGMSRADHALEMMRDAYIEAWEEGYPSVTHVEQLPVRYVGDGL